VDPYADLAGTGVALGYFADVQNVGWAELIK
jgi:hypothetical protein